MTQTLPLFPLDLVLFPKAPLPLHIFEERYRLMVARCIEQNVPFGVVLLREGVAESAGVTFYAVGTSAQISDGVKLDDGRYLINCVGQQRFRVQRLTQRLPYYAGSVTFLPEEHGDVVIDPADELRALYTRYWQAIAAATGIRPEPETLPEDVVDLTYWMAHKLQVANEQKQRWLETSPATRLREMTTALRAEMALLPDNPNGPSDGDWGGVGSWN